MRGGGNQADIVDLMTSHKAVTSELQGGGGKGIGEGWRPW
jgi:hypothetical protein